MERAREQMRHPKPKCSHCISSVMTRLCPVCPETIAAKKAAAEKAASLVCSPCMSGPAWVPPEAAASVDVIVAAKQALIDLQKATESIQLFLNVQKSLSAWQAASLSNEAPLLEEHAGAYLAPLVGENSVGSLD